MANQYPWQGVKVFAGGEAVKPDPPEERSHTQWVLACVGVSVVLGIIMAQSFDFDGLQEVRFTSLTGHGPLADLVFTAAAILLVVRAARMAVTMRPGRLALLGAVILVSAFGDQLIVTRVSASTEHSPPLFLMAITTFVGAALLGAGLRRLIRAGPAKPTIGQRKR